MHATTAALLTACSLAALPLVACAAAGSSSAAQEARPTAVSEAERVVQAQLDAYNRHDLDAFVATYTPDARGYTYPDQPTFTGAAELRAQYGQFFAAAPAVRARVVQRIVQGGFVIDREEVTGLPSGQTMRAVAVYEVRDGRIASVRFIQ